MPNPDIGTLKVCAIEGCARLHFVKGLCHLHYDRTRRGIALHAPARERGAPIAFLDEALQHNKPDCLIWPHTRTVAGYGVVEIDRERQYAHRLVCAVVHGLPPDPTLEAAHSCRNPSCVSPLHLRWKTHAQNMADMLEHGTRRRGEQTPIAKLRATDIRAIRASKKSSAEMARMLGVSPTTIADVRAHRTWKHIR